MANEVFVDTGCLYAFLDRTDEHHPECASFFSAPGSLALTSNYVIDELITLLRVRKFRVSQFAEFVDDILAGRLLQLVRITHDVEEEAWEYLKKHADRDFSFTDCTSFVLMMRRGIRHAWALDKHFSQAGFIVNPRM